MLGVDFVAAEYVGGGRGTVLFKVLVEIVVLISVVAVFVLLLPL